MSKKIKLGVVGLGHRGRYMFKLATSAFPAVEATAICDINETLVEDVQRTYPGVQSYTDFREMLAKSGLNTLLVETPAHCHAEFCLEARQRGLHVFSDIPSVASLQEAEALSTEERRRASESIVDVLAAIHAVDVDAVGLGDLGRKEDYIARQLRRWYGQFQSSEEQVEGGLDLPAVHRVHDRLAAAIPPQVGASIVHGDYRLDNCMLGEDGSIAAVLDWELCTLGDPLADVGYLGVYWVQADGESRHNDPSSAPGFPAYTDLVERYAARTGRDVSNIGYYVAFSSWRLAVISEGVYARYLHGAMGDQTDSVALELFRSATEDLATRARDALDSGA